MKIISSAKWFMDAIPRAPRRAGLLMRLFYHWQEHFTQAGHAAFALLFFSMFAGIVPGFWAAWVFCGIDFLFILALVVSLFCTSKFSKVKTLNVRVSPTVEGTPAKVSALTFSEDKMGEMYLGAFRMDPSLKCEMLPAASCAANETICLECLVHTKRRGAFKILKVATVIPEIAGMLRANFPSQGAFELLVYPKTIRVSSFPFITAGASGFAFAPLLMPSLGRGLDFVGVREYREGDSLRDLHHKAFARYGKPFTKEFEEERGAGVVLVLDTATPDYASRMQLENAIRLVAGIGAWLLERGILGRFFICDAEIPLNGRESLLEYFLQVLARIPHADVIHHVAPKTWSPAARPMGPVLRVGLYTDENPLLHKQIIVTSKNVELLKDSVLYVNGSFLEKSMEKGAEVTL